ncbi:Ribonuclease III [Botryosphaeria dothidea]|uniref:Ribonuclease III n=1 Tax=Botryosphaeria dothidea TaxID=55169 RepID=A0A8H4N6S2_9PEZI|nr:Ribonuclease III [Botryosphaeria dothidea]
MIVQELCDSAIKNIGFTDHELVLRAITASSTNENDYQRLEFLGDCILKFSTAVQLMAENLHWPESYLTEKKDRIVSNGSLAKASRRAGLDRFIITKAFTGTKWRPRYVNDILASAVAELPEKRDLSTKTLADIVESLIGAAYVEGGMLKAHLCIANLLPKLSWRSIDQSRDGLAQHATEAHSSSAPIHLERVEKLVGYTFKNKYLLLESLTHPSFVSYRDGATTSYQRLEFLGDAVLDYLVSRRLYAYRKTISSNGAQGIPPRGYAPDELPHWIMHSIRASIVNASFLAFLCMEACILKPRTEVIFTSPENPSTTTEHGDLSSTTGVPAAAPLGEPTPVQGPPVRKALWQFMRHSAPSLQAASTAAAARHEGSRDDIWEALRTSRRYPWHLLAKVGAEKFFSDIIEAVLGAIFIDSTEAEKQDPQVADDKDLKASEEFLNRLGLMDVLDRFLRDGIGWEWDEVEASDAGRIDGTVRCRVSVGERWIGDWVEGHGRLEVETAAADRAVLILLGEGRKWKGMDEINGVIATGEDGETAGTGVVGFEEDDEEEVDRAVVGAEAQREDLVMGDA